MMDLMKKLQAPFSPEDIEWRVGSTTQDKTKGLALAYVTNRAIQNRLDEVFGPLGWKNEYREWKGTSQICGISIWDYEKKEWITKWDGADDSHTEATKGGLSDAMKRAGYQWGIGRYLYKLPQVWMPLKPVGKSYVLKETPKLPNWALPEGYTYSTNKTTTDDTFSNYDGDPKVLYPSEIDAPKSGAIVYKCSETGCGRNISKGIYERSMKEFKKPLCMTCQDKARKYEKDRDNALLEAAYQDNRG